MADDALFTIAGQEFKVTTPARVLYPATGTTKLDVIRYYADVAAVMLPQVQGRPATRKRWPEGVDQASFFVKDLEPGTPPWLPRVQIRHGSRTEVLPGVRHSRGVGLVGSGRRLGVARPAVAHRATGRPNGCGDAPVR